MEDEDVQPFLKPSFMSARYQVKAEDIKNKTHAAEDEETGDRTLKKSLSVVEDIVLSWKDVNVFVEIPGKGKGCCSKSNDVEQGASTRKQILKNVCGLAQSGHLLAIMGSSGAGKSTLLNILTSRNTKHYHTTGNIHVNGYPVDKSMNEISAYVQQDDLFIDTLTVRETLQFRALLRMDKGLNTKNRLDRVEEVILEMGLTKCANSRIGKLGGAREGISGGERKRLSFAAEALTNPPIFFCDEPTSGLDTFMAQNIVQTLQKMASRGRVILCTIHQPASDIFALFDRILLMADGRTAFLGSQDKAIEFFNKLQFPCPTNYNPADHYVMTLAVVPGKEAECKELTQRICDVFGESAEAKSIKDTTAELIKKAEENKSDPIIDQGPGKKSRYDSSWVTQFRYLLWRSWVGLFRDIMLFRVRIGQVLVLGVVFGLIYLRLEIDQKSVMSINGAIFLLIINISFSNMFAVVNSFPIELAVFYREYGTGLYRSDVYYFAKTIVEIPVFILLTVIFGSITYWMIGLYASLEAFLIALGVLFLVCNVAVSLGYLISTISGSVTVALAIAPPLLIPFMLFGGLFLNSDDTPVYLIWMEYLSWFKYANEIMMVNQWQHIDNITCDAPLPPKNLSQGIQANPCPYRSGQDVLNYTGFDKDNIAFDIVMLLALILFFRLLSLIALVVRARRSDE